MVTHCDEDKDNQLDTQFSTFGCEVWNGFVHNTNVNNVVR